MLFNIAIFRSTGLRP